MRGTLAAMLAAAVLAAALPAAGASPVTLEEAIQTARKANAMLPVAATGVQIAEQQRLEAEAARRLRLALDGDFIYAPPDGYDPVVTNLGEERFQLAGDKILYDGGALAAGLRQATALRGAAGARYRQAARDVEYGVRTQFAELLAAQKEIIALDEAVRRLERYRSLLESRHAAGESVAAALSRTVVQEGTARADVIAAQARRDAARMALDTLMGRPPDAVLEPAELPPPSPPAPSPSSSGPATPDVEAARFEAAAAGAAVEVARAEPKPHLQLHADVGLWGSDTSHAVPLDFAAIHPGATFADRLKRDLGYSVGLFVSWPLTDFGAIRARIARAELASRQAAQAETATRQQVTAQWSQARTAMEHAFRQLEELKKAVPAARDAVLEAESRYFGGAGSYLEVLDAFTAAADTATRAVEAELAYRQAEALMLRWEGHP